jgi:hypothetical protein
METRRSFIKKIGLLTAVGMISSTTLAKNLYSKAVISAQNFKQKIIDIIESLKEEGSNLVKKVLNGKKYIRDPYTHYPYDGGITDTDTGCRIFFHAHRDNEYGHFHTFVTDDNGDLVHLVLISMNEDGKPFGISTVNRWVTDDKYVNADVLKSYLKSFQMEASLFKEKRIVEFIKLILNAYEKEIFELFDERDKWVQNYINTNYREPFEDRDFEVLSERKINIYS